MTGDYLLADNGPGLMTELASIKLARGGILTTDGDAFGSVFVLETYLPFLHLTMARIFIWALLRVS
jgi:hypothetical protein